VPPRVFGPQTRVLAAWMAGAPDPQVRTQASIQLGRWAVVLAGRHEVAVLSALAAALRDERDPSVHEVLEQEALAQAARIGQQDGYELVEEAAVFAGGFDDPAVLAPLEAADRALAEALDPPAAPAPPPADGF
jgi:hypothetical protein